jgi:hypothetical protein
MSCGSRIIPVNNNCDKMLLLLFIFYVYAKLASYMKIEKVSDILDKVT